MLNCNEFNILRHDVLELALNFPNFRYRMKQLFKTV